MAEHDLMPAAITRPRPAPIRFGDCHLSIEAVVAIARRQATVALNGNEAWRDRIERGARFLQEQLAQGATVYGVNTGYGDACEISVPPALVQALPLQLTRYHGCGMGRYLAPSETLAVIAARLNSLAHGYSGVRYTLLQRLADLINHDILPRIPAEGSVAPAATSHRCPMSPRRWWASATSCSMARCGQPAMYGGRWGIPLSSWRPRRDWR